LSQVKGGRYLRWYANGNSVGISLAKMFKPDAQQGLEKVLEAGNPDVFEYFKKVPETTISFQYTVISYDQLYKALAGGNEPVASYSAPGEVPPLPDNWDIVERMITPGTEGTLNETYLGFVLYQGVQVEKESWDAEVDKVLAVDISAKCKRPRRYVGVAGIQFDTFKGNGSTTAFTLTYTPIAGQDGFKTARVETPMGTKLKETVDFTVAGSTMTFTNAPASSATNNILAIYAR